MQVVKGNLTQQQVAAIVNPTNNQLGLTGGVSKHIAKAAGPDLEKACQALLASLPPGHKAVPVGSSAVTSCSGKSYKSIPCQHIIHAVGPHYTGKLTYLQHCSSPRFLCSRQSINIYWQKRRGGMYKQNRAIALTARSCCGATLGRPFSLLLLRSSS